MTAIQLRQYQREAIAAARQAWAQGVRRPAWVLPTGMGKTVTFAGLTAEMRPLGVRSLILAHRDELIGQAARTLRAVAPELRVGIYQADRREVRGRDVVVASVQTLARAERRAELAREGFRLVIVDECHHATANTYVETLRALGCFADGDLSTGAAALGVTATMNRSDRVALGQVWQDVVYRRSIVQAIREGHLVNAKGIRVKVEGLDFGRIKRMHGDFAEAALADAMRESMAPAAIARAYVEHAKDRSGVLFAPGVPMAYEMAEALRAEGIEAVGLDGTVPTTERRDILARHSRGDVQVVCNAMVLTEGWDAPWCSAVVIARPTQSAGLYVQMAGRGLRPHPGKRDALIIDVVGVTGKHKLAGLIDLGGADRVEKLPAELAEYEPDEEIDLLGLLDPEPGADGARPGAVGLDGQLTSEVVDLFGLSHRVWLRTPRGVWFVPAGDALIFLAPGDEVGAYRVGRVPQHGQGGEWLVADGVDLQMAMTWGEQHAESAGGTLNRKGATWRKGAPSGGQLAMAERLGLPTEGMSKGDLSDAISRTLATARLDAMPCVTTVSERGYW